MGGFVSQPSGVVVVGSSTSCADLLCASEHCERVESRCPRPESAGPGAAAEAGVAYVGWPPLPSLAHLASALPPVAMKGPGCGLAESAVEHAAWGTMGDARAMWGGVFPADSGPASRPSRPWAYPVGALSQCCWWPRFWLWGGSSPSLTTVAPPCASEKTPRPCCSVEGGPPVQS